MLASAWTLRTASQQRRQRCRREKRSSPLSGSPSHPDYRGSGRAARTELVQGGRTPMPVPCSLWRTARGRPRSGRCVAPWSSAAVLWVRHDRLGTQLHVAWMLMLSVVRRRNTGVAQGSQRVSPIPGVRQRSFRDGSVRIAVRGNVPGTLAQRSFVCCLGKRAYFW